MARPGCGHSVGGILINGKGVCAYVACRYPTGVPWDWRCDAWHPRTGNRPNITPTVRLEIAAMELAETLTPFEIACGRSRDIAPAVWELAMDILR